MVKKDKLLKSLKEQIIIESRDVVSVLKEYIQRLYEAEIIFIFDKNSESGVSEKIFEVRSILNVTTSKRLYTLNEDENTFRAVFSVRFVLEGQEKVTAYMNKVLKPGLVKIGGLKALIKSVKQLE
jgi:hypothetical protein